MCFKKWVRQDELRWDGMNRIGLDGMGWDKIGWEDLSEIKTSLSRLQAAAPDTLQHDL